MRPHLLSPAVIVAITAMAFGEGPAPTAPHVGALPPAVVPVPLADAEWRWAGAEDALLEFEPRGVQPQNLGDFPLWPRREVPVFIPVREGQPLRLQLVEPGPPVVAPGDLDVDMQRRVRLIRVGPAGVLPGATPRGRDAWVSSILKTTSLTRARHDAEDRLKMMIEQLAETSALSVPELQKLMLAGQGDISRFLSECEAFVAEALAIEARPADERQAELPRLWQRAIDLRFEYQLGLHHDGSLYHKRLPATVPKAGDKD